ncbi:unnamed protein product [Phyllotreta striolata]|uniref:Protein sleepless n=1 Tax=Phyllotreta striolata TaxID=444603 RepID=A0A9N9XKT9_PHYSR|nr:unnamed protein product [Phyllotreta striolata]
MKSKLNIIILYLITLKSNELNALRCYVCSDDISLPCTNFESEKEKYIQECDRSQKGCFLKIEGDNRTRSCVDKELDDCKTANGVEYCFCSSDLCNDIRGKLAGITDDEDLVEGSGSKIILDKTKEKSNNTLEKPTVIQVSSTVRNFVSLYLISILSVLILLI